MPNHHQFARKLVSKAARVTALQGCLFALCFPVFALDCIDNPDVVYDDITEDGAAIVRALVGRILVSPHGDEGSCTTLDYTTLEILRGNAPNHFTVTNCESGINTAEYDRSDDINLFTDVFGYAAGAEVVAGILALGEQQYRYLTLTCAGPLHLRLDTLAEPETFRVLDLIPDV